jgi:nitroimidazol reductase NimA-like FMN-containing flavoprotein (pyridoxamine 5'-phosphate oxidase superfamily)
MTDDGNPLAAFGRVARASCYLTLATADAHGSPWSTPVWFASADLVDFYWVSSPRARHSVNVAQRSDVALSVFDSHQAPGTGVGVYVRATAVQVPDADLDRGLAVFGAEAQRQGAGEWARDRVTDAARLRLYRATALERFVLDSRDQRVRVPDQA